MVKLIDDQFRDRLVLIPGSVGLLKTHSNFCCEVETDKSDQFWTQERIMITPLQNCGYIVHLIGYL